MRSPRRSSARRLAGALACFAAAFALHKGFCEWRVVEFGVADTGAEALVLWSLRRVEHAAGNAAAYEARKRELRAYHTDWLACRAAEQASRPDPAAVSACARQLDSGADATTRAVALAACEESNGGGLSRSAGMRRCLGERGHREPRPPRWTRDDFGPRFEGPYATLTALFAENRGSSPRSSRALGIGLGVLAPLGLCLAALRLAWTAAPRSTRR